MRADFLDAAYSYDANGNLTSGAGRTVTYASFNLPTQIIRGAVAVSFTYGPEHQRITQVSPDSTTVYLRPDGNGAPFIEKVVMGATVQWNNYLYANGAMVGVLYERNPGGVFTRYFHKDHLGSIAVITDETGAVLERLSYDAWGKRRFPNGADDPAETITSQSDRGFTGHEHLADVGLIHMNGRIYDPVLGRFMTADPIIDGLFSTQGLNRYGYVHNNPLAYVDPTGLFLKGLRNFFKSNPIAALAVGFATAWVLGPVGLGWIDGVFTLQGAMITGGVSGFLTNGLQGAFFGVVSGALTGGIASLKLDFLTSAILHGLAQGTLAELQGGEFGPAFLAAAVSKVGGYGLERVFPGKAIDALIAKGVGAAIIGGTAAVIGGGKFQNGAATAAFVYAFNQAASALEASAASASAGAGTATGSGILQGLGAAANRLLGVLGLVLSLTGDTPSNIDLYRAVSAAELADIVATGQYRILPGGVEGKYFAITINDARYFRDQAVLEADSIVRSTVSRETFIRLEQGSYDRRPAIFATPATLPLVNQDARRFGGIQKVE